MCVPSRMDHWKTKTYSLHDPVSHLEFYNFVRCLVTRYDFGTVDTKAFWRRLESRTAVPTVDRSGATPQVWDVYKASYDGLFEFRASDAYIVPPGSSTPSGFYTADIELHLSNPTWKPAYSETSLIKWGTGECLCRVELREVHFIMHSRREFSLSKALLGITEFFQSNVVVPLRVSLEDSKVENDPSLLPFP